MLGVFLIIFISQLLMFAALLAYLLTGQLTQTWLEIFLIRFFGIQFAQHKSYNHKIDPSTRLIAANHRSFADFFIDSHLSGHSTHLSRWMVAAVLPLSALYAFFTGRVLFFWRGQTKRQQLQHKILDHQKAHPFPTIFYPEQHRSTAPDPLPLRHGVLKICFENNMPIQILIASDKENVFNEKTGQIGWNLTSRFGITAPIVPADFKEYLDFYQEFEKQWLCLWDKVYHSETTDFEKYPLKAPPIQYHFTKAWFSFWGIFLLIFLSYYGFNII